MRVLLAYPEFPDTFWSFRHALRFVRKKATQPPLGLLTVAALLPKSWELRLVDMNVRPLTRGDLDWADLVFVSAMVIQRDATHRLLARCQEAGVKVVAGGPLFLAEHADFPEVDYLVLNEAEVTLPAFLADLERGQLRRIYASDEYADMEASPTPLWELADLRQYADAGIQYSRGCPFQCEFCNVTVMLGHQPRVKTARQVIAELDRLYRLGWRDGVGFLDDNFIGNRRALKAELLPALIAWRQGKQGMHFQTEASIDLADDPELLDLMVQAGFVSVFVGIETPDAASLSECHKKQNQGRDLVAAVKSLQRAGMEVQAGFIVGFDSDTPSIFQRQIEFIQQSGIGTAMVGLLTAFTGTQLYERLKLEGRLLANASGNNTDNILNFRPKMDSQVLHEGYRRILLTIYAPHAYYQRVRIFLSEFRRSGAVRATLGWAQGLAFLRTVYVLGIRGQERVEYWKLLLWTLRHHPGLLEQAVRQAVYGFHFRRICELYVQADQAD